MSLSRHVSMLLKGSLALTALVAAGSLMAEPASAQSAIRGAGVIVRPSGSSQSLSVEVENKGGYFDGTGAVTPTYVDDTALGTNQESFEDLTVTATFNLEPSLIGENPVLTAIANQISAQTFITVEEMATLIRAAAGSDGLD